MRMAVDGNGPEGRADVKCGEWSKLGRELRRGWKMAGSWCILRIWVGLGGRDLLGGPVAQRNPGYSPWDHRESDKVVGEIRKWDGKMR